MKPSRGACALSLSGTALAIALSKDERPAWCCPHTMTCMEPLDWGSSDSPPGVMPRADERGCSIARARTSCETPRTLRELSVERVTLLGRCQRFLVSRSPDTSARTVGAVARKYLLGQRGIPRASVRVPGRHLRPLSLPSRRHPSLGRVHRDHSFDVDEQSDRRCYARQRPVRGAAVHDPGP